MDLSGYRFPLFVDLNGKKAVIIGGGKVAVRRASLLLLFGAEVTIIAPQCAAPPKGAVFCRRSYQKGDLAGAFLAIAATDDRAVNRLVGLEAAERGIPVSVADRKEESSFYFPAVCAGNGLVAGIVSDGAQHHKTAAAARAVRAVLEGLE